MIQTAYQEAYRPQFHFTPKTNLDERSERIDLLQRRVPPLFSAQPIRYQLG